MNLYYVSDLHLKSENDALAKLLLRFLNQIPAAGDILILGGDIFDLFIGSDQFFQKKFRNIIDGLRQLAGQGCQIYYLEGNHDFHLENVFAREKNIFLKKDDFSISFGAKRIWISHGDMINQRDYGYLFLRWITRTKILRWLIQRIPGAFIDKVGSWSSDKSRRYNNSYRISDTRVQFTKGLFREYAEKLLSTDFDFVLIGHSHIQDRWKPRPNLPREYINLGISPSGLPYLSLANPGEFAETLVFK